MPVAYLAMSNLVQLLVGCGVLIVVAVILWLIVLWLRKRLFSISASRVNRNEAFTINQLRSLRDSGDISQEEFSRVRRALLGGEGENITSQSSGAAGGADEEKQQGED